MIRRTIWIGIAAIAALGMAAARAEGGAAPQPVPSAADFGALPFLTGPILAPDGLRYAARGTAQGKPVVLVVDMTVKDGIRTVGVPDRYTIEWYRWAGDTRLLISVSFKTTLEGEEVRATRLVAYDVTNGTSHFVGAAEEGIDGDNVLYVDPAGSYILLGAQQTIYEYPSVMRIDIATNRVKRVVDARDNVWDWYADNNGVVRAGVGRDGNRWWVLYRSDATGKFDTVMRRRLDTDKVDDVDRFLPVAGTDQGFAIAAGKSGRFGLYRYDFRADKMGELIYENPTNDIDDFDLAPDGQVRSVSYIDDRARMAWFDPQLKDVQAAIDKALPRTVNRIVSIDKDAGRLIVWTGSASNPGAYYLFDGADGRMHVMARPYEALIGKRLADMETVTYKARDGLAIPAYLTMPTTGGASTGLPLVIMPHGGPFARDEWGYDAWAQFLASKGYVVLQPNFRGSTGYGKDFVEHGYGQWGRGMQNDIDDGVAWLARRGVIDPKRVCIMGASFGGYAAEWAAVRNPELYRCAISFAGVSDVAAQLKYDRKSFAAPRYFRDWRAKIQGTDGTTLDAISPARHAGEIKVPLLIAHGDADTNVPLNQSQRLVDALAKAGRPADFHVYKGEGHGFTKADDQIDFLKRVEAFLAKHNPA